MHVSFHMRNLMQGDFEVNAQGAVMSAVASVEASMNVQVGTP